MRVLTSSTMRATAVSGSSRRHEIEIAAVARRADVGHAALVDAVGVDDDAALGGLAEHLGEPHHRHGARRDDVGQHLAGADRGQLVDVADDQQRGAVRHRAQQRVHQRHIHHGGLVDHQQVAFQRIAAGAAEAAVDGIDFEQAMDGAGIAAGRLAHALGGAPGRRAQQDRDILGGEDAQDGVDDGGLADARARR